MKPKRRLIPTPRGSVKQMVQDYKENIIAPPVEFRNEYKPIPAPRPKKQLLEKPIPAPRTKKMNSIWMIVFFNQHLMTNMFLK